MNQNYWQQCLMALKTDTKSLANYTWPEAIEKYYKLVEVLMVNRL